MRTGTPYSISCGLNGFRNSTIALPPEQYSFRLSRPSNGISRRAYGHPYCNPGVNYCNPGINGARSDPPFAAGDGRAINLFGGEITPEYSKEFAFNQLLDGYKTSISTLNKAISFNIAFAVLALYVFIALPSEKTMEAPFIGLELSQSTWLQVAPLVAFCLQTFVFTSFLWFMLLRLGQKIVVQQMGEDKGFADVTDIALSGPIAQVWIVIRFGACLHSKWEHHLVSTFVAWTARRAAPLQKSPW